MNNKIFVFLFSIIFLFLLAHFSPKLLADSKINELEEKISAKNQEIQSIEEEIKQYQTEINKTLEEQNTLKNEISQLQTTANKLNAEMRLTQKEIDNANFNIEKINLEIEQKNDLMEKQKNSLAETLRSLNEEDSNTLLEILLAHNNLSDFFDNVERMGYLQKDINLSLEELKNYKIELGWSKEKKKKEKDNLEMLSNQLSDQKKIADANTANKNALLKETKNKEANYKTLLDEKTAKRDAFLEELSSLEAQLKIEIDPNSIPQAGTGILKWPLDDLSLESCWEGGNAAKNCVTQFFGSTPFATQNPQVYGGSGHNGVDFRASVGTPVKTALAGVVEDTGDTDAIKGCYSYGKWVLIRHNNGLSTLYAHLSLIKVQKGQAIQTRELIGYSGQTGFATGPHLHFGVYATQGVQVTKFTNSINCKNAFIPIADVKAYLNPLSYL